MYALLRQLRREEQAATGNVPPEGTKKTQSKKPYNIILACVYWYVGNRGEVLSSPPGSLLQRRTSNLLKKHLLEPCEDKIPGKIRTDAPKGAKNVQQRIHRIDDELRLLDARIIPLLSK